MKYSQVGVEIGDSFGVIVDIFLQIDSDNFKAFFLVNVLVSLEYWTFIGRELVVLVKFSPI